MQLRPTARVVTASLRMPLVLHPNILPQAKLSLPQTSGGCLLGRQVEERIKAAYPPAQNPARYEICQSGDDKRIMDQ